MITKEEHDDIKSEINVIGEISTNDVKGDVPKDAEYAKLNPTGEFIEKFYKFKNVKYSDGTNMDILMYWGEQKGWHPSSFNDKNGKDYKKLKDIKFLKIA